MPRTGEEGYLRLGTDMVMVKVMVMVMIMVMLRTPRSLSLVSVPFTFIAVRGAYTRSLGPLVIRLFMACC